MGQWGGLVSATIGIFCALSSYGAGPGRVRGEYAEYVGRLRNLSKRAPAYAHVFELGKNDEAIPIFALRISESPAVVDLSKRGHLVVAAHHGDEKASVELALTFAADLLKRYKERSLATQDNLRDIEWTILPVLNIQGINSGSRTEYDIDPNRDYPGPCQEEPTFRLTSVRSLAEYLQKRPMVASATLHTYYGTMTYPWGVKSTNARSNDEGEYHRLVSLASKENGYKYGSSTDLVFGANGTFEDYVYWKHGTWSLLVELLIYSRTEIENTTRALRVYFDNVRSSPSGDAGFNGRCGQVGE